jgi:hypothetical protein
MKQQLLSGALAKKTRGGFSDWKYLFLPMRAYANFLFLLVTRGYRSHLSFEGRPVHLQLS